MAVTFAQMQELVLRKAQEDGTDLTTNPIFTPTWVKAQLNAAVHQFLLRMPPRFCRTSATIDAATTATALPTSFLGHCAIRFQRGTDYRWLKFFKPEEWDLTKPSWSGDTASDPTHYTILFGADGTTKYQLYPTLTAAVTNGLLLRYTAKPTDMSADSDTCVALTWFPHLQSRLLVHYVLWQIMDFEGPDRQERALWYRGRWEEDIQEATRTLNSLYVQSGTWR